MKKFAGISSMFMAAITPSSAGGSASAVILAERLLDAVFFISALPIFMFLSGFSAKLGLKVGIVFFVSLVVFIAFLYMGVKKPERADVMMNKILSPRSVKYLI